MRYTILAALGLVSALAHAFKPIETDLTGVIRVSGLSRAGVRVFGCADLPIRPRSGDCTNPVAGMTDFQGRFSLKVVTGVSPVGVPPMADPGYRFWLLVEGTGVSVKPWVEGGTGFGRLSADLDCEITSELRCVVLKEKLPQLRGPAVIN